MYFENNLFLIIVSNINDLVAGSFVLWKQNFNDEVAETRHRLLQFKVSRKARDGTSEI